MWIANLCWCSVIEQPFKIPFVAAVVLLVNAQKSELTVALLNKTAEMTQSFLVAGRWREVKLLIRFLGCLQGMFEGDGVFPILEELFARAVDLQTASSEDVCYLNIWMCGLEEPANAFIVPWSRACEDHSLHDSLCHDVFCEWVRIKCDGTSGKD